ncbi:O-glucosyltransferase rumi homolog [Camellia sinensis]|uniref:O-glucosyltransferase rumi homolog n=1 Tax=Camellia sinensis TaxID=4442 RepID=UPI00103612F2|nr:O-glucosyltransferase rumi homolog [Camellia sinensis]
MRENIEGFQRYVVNRYASGVYRHFRDTMISIWRRLPLPITKKASSSRSLLFFIFFLLFFFGAFLASRLLDTTVTSLSENTPPKTILTTRTTHVYSHEPAKIPEKPQRKIEIPLNCSSSNLTQTCPPNYYPTRFHLQDDQDRPSPAMCPEYFRWIHEDLRPWRETGITRDMVERANRTANFRLVIVNGRAYIERYRRAFQTRDIFTQWGILQLLRRYPGKLPDLDLMFDCVDWPVIKSMDYRGPNATSPPPLFRYCGDDATLDIVFPDWSFWGWPEINIKPWEGLLEDLKGGNKRKRWMEREAYAYWKGNPIVAATRMDLLKCNVSEKHDWGARVYAQNWIQESQQGYKQSDLASQCIHRYKIYIEGSAWSVSEKYILACNSVTFVVKPHYYDFFTRGLMPVHHYWPIRDNDKCRSIKFAVDWGNNHKQKAQAIGKAASDFIQEDLKMDYVYDYMFHLLNEYAKLMRYKPTVPRKAIELCSEIMACRAEGLQKKFMMESMVKGPATDTSPCTMPPPYDPHALHSLLRRKANSERQVELWEKKFWENQTTHN